MDRIASVAFPPNPALAWRSFRLHRAWRRGPGRYAGHLAAPLVLLWTIAFLGSHVVEETVCLSDRGAKLERCDVAAAWINYAIYDLFFLTIAFCLSTSISGFRMRAALARRRRAYEAQENQFKNLLLQDPASQAPLEKLRLATGRHIDPNQDENQLRLAANTYLGLGIAAGVLLLHHLQRVGAHMTGEGSMAGPLARFIFFAIPVLWLATYGMRPSRKMRRAANELRDDAEAQIAAHAARLEQVRTGDTDGPAFSFQRYQSQGPIRPGTTPR